MYIEANSQFSLNRKKWVKNSDVKSSELVDYFFFQILNFDWNRKQAFDIMQKQCKLRN